MFSERAVEAGRSRARWANAPQAGDRVWGWGSPNRVQMTNDPEVHLPGLSTALLGATSMLYRPSLTITEVETFVVFEAKSAPKFHSIVGEKVRPMPPV